MINGSNLEHIYTHTNRYRVRIGVRRELLSNKCTMFCVSYDQNNSSRDNIHIDKLGSWIGPQLSKDSKSNLDREK